MSQLLKDQIARVPDFPKEGVLFYDLTPIFADALSFMDMIVQMTKLAGGFAFDKIAAIEARGFVLGSALALASEVGLVLIRKEGKLPRIKHQISHRLEYGKECHEIHQNDIVPGDRVLIVDDILATGGTARAAADLVRACQGEVSGYLFVARIVGIQKEDLDSDGHGVACLIDLP